MDTIVFGDAVSLAVGHLGGLLTVPVRGAVPNPRPAEFVTIRRIGGPRQTMVSDNAMLSIEAWAKSEAAAHDLAQLTRAHIYAMQGAVVAGVQVYGVVEVGGPAALPDPLSEQPRYTFAVQLAYRGHTV